MKTFLKKTVSIILVFSAVIVGYNKGIDKNFLTCLAFIAGILGAGIVLFVVESVRTK